MTSISSVFHSIPILSLFYYSLLLFLSSQPFFLRLEERARDGAARYDSRDERNGTGRDIIYSLEKNAFVCLFHWNRPFSSIQYEVLFFPFPTFSFPSNCISLRPFCLLDEHYHTYFLVTFPHSSLLPPLLPSLPTRVFLVSPFLFTYNSLYKYPPSPITCNHSLLHTYPTSKQCHSDLSLHRLFPP